MTIYIYISFSELICFGWCCCKTTFIFKDKIKVTIILSTDICYNIRKNLETTLLLSQILTVLVIILVIILYNFITNIVKKL